MGERCVVREHATTQTVLNEEIENERNAAALGVPRKRVLGIKVLLRAGVCRLREKLARSITSLAPALTLTMPCLCGAGSFPASRKQWYSGSRCRISFFALCLAPRGNRITTACPSCNSCCSWVLEYSYCIEYQ